MIPWLARSSRLIRRTPLHPQWLLGPRRVPRELEACQGMIVDVGAADQWLASRLHPGATYVSLDLPSAGGVPYGLAPDVYASAQALPLANDSVDAIACLEVLEHVERPERVISEAGRVLRPGGLYIVSTPFIYPMHDRPMDFRRYSPHGLRLAFSDAGLEVVAIRPMLCAIKTAGLLAALAVAGGLTKHRGYWLLAPIAMPLVFLINIASWAGSHLWPEWDGMAMGYEAIGRKR